MSRAGPGGSRKCARALADVCRDIDRFLDPTVLALVAREEIAVAAGARGRGEEASEREPREKRRRSSSSSRRAPAPSCGASTRRASPDEGSELQDPCDELRRLHEAERRRLQAEIDRRDEQLRTAELCGQALVSSERGPSSAARNARGEAEDLRAEHVLIAQDRDALQREVEALRSSRLASSQELAALQKTGDELRSKHAYHEESFAAQQTELEQLRSKHVLHEQERGALQAQVVARDKALSDVGSAASGAELARRDLAALAAVAASIIVEFSSNGNDGACSAEASGTGSVTNTKVATPFELNLAWSKWQRRMADVNQHCEDLQRSLEQASRREHKAREELRRLRADLAASQARCADREADLRRAESEGASLASRNSTLREALQRAGAAPPEPAHEQPHADLSGKLQERETELRRCTEELAALRSERQASEGVQPDCEPGEKILHLLHRPFDPTASAVGPANVEALAACDLERAQAVKQFKCLQRGVKKHVLDYKEGIAALLGWHIEMREGDSSSRWHLTSKLQVHEGQSLIFQRKPGPGRKIDFELMSTPWAEQLQEDRQAISYIELYRSIPGFLAHITADLLAKRTLNG